MVHGVGGEERGGERLLSPLLLVCTSLQTLEDGGHTGLYDGLFLPLGGIPASLLSYTRKTTTELASTCEQIMLTP